MLLLANVKRKWRDRDNGATKQRGIQICENKQVRKMAWRWHRNTWVKCSWREVTRLPRILALVPPRTRSSRDVTRLSGGKESLEGEPHSERPPGSSTQENQQKPGQLAVAEPRRHTSEVQLVLHQRDGRICVLMIFLGDAEIATWWDVWLSIDSHESSVMYTIGYLSRLVQAVLLQRSAHLTLRILANLVATDRNRS